MIATTLQQFPNVKKPETFPSVSGFLSFDCTYIQYEVVYILEIMTTDKS